MSPEKTLDRIERILRDYAADYYDDKPDRHPLTDIAETLDRYRATTPKPKQ